MRSESVVDCMTRHVAVTRADLLGELGGVGQVAVVPEGDAPVAAGAVGGLGVLPRAGTGRRVATVPDRQMAAQAAERDLVEDLGDEPEFLVDDDAAPVGDGDAGRFLPAVLQRVEAVVGELRDFLAPGEDAEHATGVPWGGVLRDSVTEIRRRRDRFGGVAGPRIVGADARARPERHGSTVPAGFSGTLPAAPYRHLRVLPHRRAVRPSRVGLLSTAVRVPATGLSAAGRGPAQQG